MKKRNIEDEILNLDMFVRNNELIPIKIRNSILKHIDSVRKCAKPRRSNKGRNQNQNSGLLKPVIISEEMAHFANWGVEELHSRVDVTKVICAYVKNNMLQKQTNKKTIIPDDELAKILNWYSIDEEMHVIVTKINENNLFSILKTPTSGLKDAKFYNNSELRKESDGETLAIIKKVELLEDGHYSFVFDIPLNLVIGEQYVVHVPLTYPKVQTKISIHLIKPEKVDIPKEIKPKRKKKAPSDK
jgi:hypothetical protein